MSEIIKLNKQMKKMETLCADNEISCCFAKNSYPLTFTIRPLEGSAEQLSMLERAEEEGYTSPEACMKWQYADDELRQVVKGGSFTIDVALRKKIESLLLKIILLWLQEYFREHVSNGTEITSRDAANV